jgi:hypothetical protein
MRRIAVLLCLLSLPFGVASARADGVVPVEGNWNATTSAGLPVSFEVREGHVLKIRFKFRWGFCGVFDTATSESVAIDAGGRWKYQDSRGPSIEATFSASDRAEGLVFAPDRMLPGCPQTEATFSAAPGPPIPLPPPKVLVKDSVVGGRLVERPHRIVLAPKGSFYLRAIRWQSYGDRVARATGMAYARAGCATCAGREVERPRVRLRLDHLHPYNEDLVYRSLHYVLLGPVPRGFAHRGSLALH